MLNTFKIYNYWDTCLIYGIIHLQLSLLFIFLKIYLDTSKYSDPPKVYYIQKICQLF